MDKDTGRATAIAMCIGIAAGFAVGAATHGGRRRGGRPMRKRQAAAALALLSAVSTLCLKGMKAIGRRMEEKQKKQEGQRNVLG